MFDFWEDTAFPVKLLPADTTYQSNIIWEERSDSVGREIYLASNGHQFEIH